MSVLALCKFTPLGFETKLIVERIKEIYGVNLPRWGLKLGQVLKYFLNTKMCKFTPLGFETYKHCPLT